MNVDMKIEGLDELAARSKKLSKSFERTTLRTALRNAAKPVRKYARMAVKVNTGRLKKQIKSKAKVLRSGFGYADVSYTTDAPYGGFVEDDDPYLVPALEDAHADGSAEAAFITAINKTIAKVLGR